MENEKLGIAEPSYTEEAIDKIADLSSGETPNISQPTLIGEIGSPTMDELLEKSSTADETALEGDDVPAQHSMTQGKHLNSEFGEDEGIDLEDNLFNSEDFLAPLKMTEEEIEKSKKEISEIKGLIGNLVLEVDKAIANTIKTNYFEVLKTQREIIDVQDSINTCINVIKIRQEMESLSQSDEKRTDVDTELADKISHANEEELIGSSNYDELLDECKNLNAKIDAFLIESEEFINENKESVKFTSKATNGIIEMLNHMIEEGNDTIKDEEKNRLLSFIEVYKHRGETELFDMYDNENEICKSYHKFKKVYAKKKKVIRRYIKTILGNILGKNNVNLFYNALLKLYSSKPTGRDNEQSFSEESMDLFVYVICRIVHLQKTDSEKLKAKLTILSIFDIYYDVYDYDNIEEIKEGFSKMVNRLLMMQIASEIRKECKNSTYDFPVTIPITVEETK